MTMKDIDFPYPVEVIDIDKNQDIAIEYGIRGVPHLILMDDDNNIIKRIGGAVSKEKLIEELL